MGNRRNAGLHEAMCLADAIVNNLPEHEIRRNESYSVAILDGVVQVEFTDGRIIEYELVLKLAGFYDD